MLAHGHLQILYCFVGNPILLVLAYRQDVQLWICTALRTLAVEHYSLVEITDHYNYGQGLQMHHKNAKHGGHGCKFVASDAIWGENRVFSVGLYANTVSWLCVCVDLNLSNVHCCRWVHPAMGLRHLTRLWWRKPVKWWCAIFPVFSTACTAGWSTQHGLHAAHWRSVRKWWNFLNPCVFCVTSVYKNPLGLLTRRCNEVCQPPS